MKNLFAIYKLGTYSLGQRAQCPHCSAANKMADRTTMKSGHMKSHDYTRRRNETSRYIHLIANNKYGIKNSKKLRPHSI